MKTTNLKALLRNTLAIITSLALSATPAFAQGVNPKTNGKILYHDGPVMGGSVSPAVYLIWYGNWSDPNSPGNHLLTRNILLDYISNLGSSPYFRINTGYPDSSGEAPNGALIYAGSVDDTYSHGIELNPVSLKNIVSEAVLAGWFPLDTTGIYLVLSSSDVSGTDAGFCVPKAPPHHGIATVVGAGLKYAYVGNPMRCPSIAAANHSSQPTPNSNLAADAMASTIAAVLSTTLTNPLGNGWFDRNGLENATKCRDSFGQTYLTENGARANMRLGLRDYLLQQIWVNHQRKGFCGLSATQ